MDWRVSHADGRPSPQDATSIGAVILYGLVAIYAIHQLLVYLEYPILSPMELLWNTFVSLTPSRLVLDTAKRRQLTTDDMWSQTHAAKSEALRHILGWGGTTLSHGLTGSEGFMRRMSGLVVGSEAATTTSDAPPGLGNWDNSCYQNSVLQGLASLESLKAYLSHAWGPKPLDVGTSTAASLRETTVKLNDPANNGKCLWTPAKLKNMSSWQQQDAQEYFSKIMDELDKEASRAVAAQKERSGLEAAVDGQRNGPPQPAPDAGGMEPWHNPLEGLLAQRVACTRCGYSEGLSMIPFNCLTVPLGSNYSYDLAECLDEYTNLEEINEVECAKCTLLRAEGQLKQMFPPPECAREARRQDAAAPNQNATKAPLSLPPEIRMLAAKRLEAIQQALDSDSFSDKTLNEACQIPKKARVLSTKTRQAVIGRAPQSLAIHVNRSVFDELTGMQRKNYARVQYPLILDLGGWVLDERKDGGAGTSLLSRAKERDDPGGLRYRLKAAVAHYGRHENGHYICYRQHPSRPTVQDAGSRFQSVDGSQALRWWRLSDEDVSAVTEDDVLAQQGVFMLFYEREMEIKKPVVTQDLPDVVVAKHNLTEAALRDDALALQGATDLPSLSDVHMPLADIDIEQPKAEPPANPIMMSTDLDASSQHAAQDDEHPESSRSTTTDDSDFTTDQEVQEEVEKPILAFKEPATPPLMRTARGRQVARKDSMGENRFANAFRPMAAT